MQVGSALKVMHPGSEFEAKKTVKSGQKLDKAKTDMTKAVAGLGVRPQAASSSGRTELWVRAANAIAFLLMLFAIFRWCFPTTMWALPFAAFFVLSIGVVGRRCRHSANRSRDANYGRAQADSTGC